MNKYDKSVTDLLTLDLSDLRNNDDKIGDIINCDEHVESLPALAVINNKYVGVGFDHQDAVENIIHQVKVKPYTVSRGFVDLNNHIAFLITYAANKNIDPTIGFILRHYPDYKDEGEPTIDFKEAARLIKEQIHVEKVYALWEPDIGQHTRLAKKLC